MNKKIITKATFVLLWAVSTCWASGSTKACGCTESPDKHKPENTKVDPVDAVLKQLNKKTSELKSYQGQIEYKYIQPSLFDSEALRKGTLYYTKLGGKSSLRVNFQTLKQEDEKEEKYVEHYIVLDGAQLAEPGRQFKGTWLVQVDYQIEAVRYYQLTEPNDSNEPVDVFELASRNLPMIGFTRVEDLKKQFEVTLVEQKKAGQEDFIQVHLKIKPNSFYKDDYVSIDFWIDKKLGLPAKIVAVKTEPEALGDIEEIRFLKPKVNKKINKKVFEFKIPRSFGEPEIIPLKKRANRTN